MAPVLTNDGNMSSQVEPVIAYNDQNNNKSATIPTSRSDAEQEANLSQDRFNTRIARLEYRTNLPCVHQENASSTSTITNNKS